MVRPEVGEPCARRCGPARLGSRGVKDSRGRRALADQVPRSVDSTLGPRLSRGLIYPRAGRRRRSRAQPARKMVASRQSSRSSRRGPGRACSSSRSARRSPARALEEAGGGQQPPARSTTARCPCWRPHEVPAGSRSNGSAPWPGAGTAPRSSRTAVVGDAGQELPPCRAKRRPAREDDLVATSVASPWHRRRSVRSRRGEPPPAPPCAREAPAGVSSGAGARTPEGTQPQLVWR